MNTLPMEIEDNIWSMYYQDKYKMCIYEIKHYINYLKDVENKTDEIINIFIHTFNVNINYYNIKYLLLDINNLLLLIFNNKSAINISLSNDSIFYLNCVKNSYNFVSKFPHEYKLCVGYILNKIKIRYNNNLLIHRMKLFLLKSIN